MIKTLRTTYFWFSFYFGSTRRSVVCGVFNG